MADTRVGDWIETYTGRQFYPLDPRVEDIDVVDIAHALSQICRFNGHCSDFYPVAQHVVLVSRAIEVDLVLSGSDATTVLQASRWGLHHDDSEAYIGDVPRPLKRQACFDPYRAIERVIMRKVAEKFDLWPEPRIVKVVDNRMLMTERRDLMRGKGVERDDGTRHAWVEEGILPYADIIVPWSPKQAETEYLRRFSDLAR